MKRMFWFGSAVLAAHLAMAAQIVSLEGAWTLRPVEEDETISGTVPMTVPGDVQSALYAAGKIKDPFWGRNERDIQWVGQKEWLIERTFDVPAPLLARTSVILRLERVDTFCEVTVNGKKLGVTGNAFRRYDYDVTGLLKPTGNTFSARFLSSERVSEERAAGLPYPVPMSDNGIVPHLNLIRKPACDGGWDWGIALMKTGFLEAPRLIGVNEARIDYLFCDQKHGNGEVELTITADTFAPVGGIRDVVLEVLETGQRLEGSVELDPGPNRIRMPVTLRNPQLWWPAGYGKQPLYTVLFTVGDDTFRRRIGLRTVEVVNQRDNHGTSMTFRINGRDIFCKGANWIPCDAFANRQTRERYSDLLHAAVDANMNMIRLWGGGQFEAGSFYDLCDELGLMIWHDYMFSCSLYPVDADFLGEVEAELAHQLPRLRDHASIVLWCGDNECLGAIGWYEESRRNRDRYIFNYDRLNQLLARVTKELDPTRMFWPSSPCGGPGDFSDGWHNDRKGDMHNWNVWHENKDFADYYNVKPRFCSEFGFQSFPSRKTAETYCKPEDVNPTSPDFEYHQKNIGGNTRILSTMTRYFRFPESADAILYLSQVQQALAIKTAVEGWRRLQPRCMGTLFWQLNDNWPVASWSSIEYGGKWKHLHYHAKRFYAPLAIAVVPSTANRDTLKIWCVNDNDRPLEGKAKIELWPVDGTAPLETINVSTTLPARGATCVEQFNVKRFGNEEERISRFLAVTFTTEVDGETRHSNNHWMFAPYKAAPLAKADVRVTPSRSETGTYRVSLSTDKPAFFVWLDAPIRGEFSDNSLLLLPGSPVTLDFHPKGEGTFRQFTDGLHVMHLRMTYGLGK